MKGADDRAKPAAQDPPPVSDPPAERTGRSPDDEARFRQLAREWRKGTAHLSSAARMAKHPAYQEIIRMGESAVPLLLAELARKPGHWFLALHTITGANPVPPGSEGNINEMVQAWIRWGKDKGYVE